MALLTAPASSVRPEARVRSGGRLAARARSTPGRLTALMLLAIARLISRETVLGSR